MIDEQRLEAVMAFHCVGPIEARRIIRLEDRDKKPKLRPEDLPTFHKPFKPVIMDPSKVSDHWKQEQVEFRKKGPRWASPLYAKAMAEDTTRAPEFHHKAALVLSERGMSGPAISKVLGISLRSVRAHLARPCPALEAEREGTTRRLRREHFSQSRHGHVPFSPDDGPFRQLRTRDKVRLYLADGVVSQRQMARLMGITQQAVSKHVRTIISAA